MNDNGLKLAATVTLTAVGVYFHELLFPLALLLCVMAADYATGMVKAWMEHALSSKVGLAGIVKKLCYLFGVGVAVCADFVVQIAAEEAGMNLAGRYFCGLLVAVWLILNECISILENLDAIGVPVPSFLKQVIVRLKQSAEEKGGKQNENNET